MSSPVSLSNKDIARQFFENLWVEPAAAQRLATDDVTWVTCRSVPIPGAEDEGTEHVGWNAVMHVAQSGLALDNGYVPETMKYSEYEFFDVEGDRVIFRFTMVCETKSGSEYVNDYLFFISIRGGLVSRFQEYWDSKQAFDLLIAPSAASR